MLNFKNPRNIFSEIKAVHDTVKIMKEQSFGLETDKRRLKGREWANKGGYIIDKSLVHKMILKLSHSFISSVCTDYIERLSNPFIAHEEQS
jgi:hypothetical protein